MPNSMESIAPVPPAHIPPSSSTVKVSIIDTTTRISGMTTEMFFQNPIPGHTVMNDAPSWAFLIEHSASKTKLLFDAGTRTDWKEKLPPASKLPPHALKINTMLGKAPDDLKSHPRSPSQAGT